MTRDEYKQKITKALGFASPEHQASMSELLTELSDDYESVLTDSESASEKVTELTKNNETLRAVNAKLFLKVGEVPKDVPKTTEQEEDIPNVTFESLFNDKGELI